MTSQTIRRFWKNATILDLPGGYGIALDGKPVRAPSKRPLFLATRALAEACAAEWQGVGETLNPQAMPLTRLANTQFDRVAPQRDLIVNELLAYVDSDVLCYHAAEPPVLRERHQALWLPLLAWAEERYGEPWQTTTSLMPIAQSAGVHGAMRQALESLDDAALTTHQASAPLLGSLLLGLALVEGLVTAEAAFQAAFVDELWQSEHWGEDYEAIDRRLSLKTDLLDAETFLRLTRKI